MKRPMVSLASFQWTIYAYASNEVKTLLRGKAWIIMFLVPAMLAGILGPAVSGLEGEAASGRAVIGFAVMFSYMVVFWVGHAFYREYWYGTYVRQAVLKPPLFGFLIGKMLPAMALTLLQLLVFFTISILILDLPLHGGVFQLLLTCIALIASGAALSFLLYVTTRSWLIMSNFAYLILVSFGTLGGSLVVWSKLPRWSQVLGYFTPHYWALTAIDEATVGNGRWLPILKSLLVLSAITFTLLAIGIMRFDYKRQKHGADI
jgi:ABC-2 type transport system permease protein